ncbi:Site-specific recombinase [Massilia sp. LC238]|nr:Site-specific recombinase [Massilia sp. LC238]
MQKKGRSRLRQQEAYEEWCAKHGVIPSDDRFLDEGKSGYTGDHVGPKGQLRRFLDLVEDEKIPKGSYLVVESLDRLGRDSVERALERFLGILNAGVNIVTLMDGEKVYFAGKTKGSDLIMSIIVMERANEESETKSKRSKDNWQAAFEKARKEKKPVGKQVAFWLDLVEKDGKKEYEPNPVHTETIKRIFDDCIAGHGFVATARRLNADKRETQRADSWGPSSVRDVLENKCVLGQWEPKDGGGVIEGYFPQIIKPATWELAHAAMAKRSKGDYTRQTPNFQVWQQIASCSVCGSSMNLVTKGAPPYRYKYLSCANKRRGLCESLNVRADKSELVYKRLLVAVGGLGLIQTDAAEITDQMALVDASIHAEETTRARHMKKLTEPDAEDFLYELVAIANKNLKRLKAEREELEAKHTAQTVAQSDRDWLLANLPLTERDDRQRANALLCRLNIKVRIRGGDEAVYTATRPTQVSTVVLPIPDDQEPEFVTRTVERPFLQFIVRGDDIIPVPLSADQRETLKEQDADGSETAKGMAWLSEKLGPKKVPA